MKKLIYTLAAVVFVISFASANPRLKNKKHFGKDYDPNKKVEIPLTTLSELNKGPQYKNAGHQHDVENGRVVDLDNENTLKGPAYKNKKHFQNTGDVEREGNSEIAGN